MEQEMGTRGPGHAREGGYLVWVHFLRRYFSTRKKVQGKVAAKKGPSFWLLFQGMAGKLEIVSFAIVLKETRKQSQAEVGRRTIFHLFFAIVVLEEEEEESMDQVGGSDQEEEDQEQ